MQKSSIISWFRYHHYNTSPVLESHQHFIDCLNFIEKDVRLGESMYMDTGWKEILAAINALSEEELNKLSTRIKRK